MSRWIVRLGTFIFCFLLLSALLNLKRIGTPLPDGSRLVVAGITHGKGDHIPPPVPQTIGSVIRSAAGQDNRREFGPLTAEGDETVVWVRRIPGVDPTLPLATYVHDEHGNGFFTADVSPVRVPAFACWGKEIRLKFYAVDGQTSTSAAEFTFPNKFAGKYMPFQAEPMPITKTTDKLQVTLEKFGNMHYTPHAGWFTHFRHAVIPHRCRIKLSVLEDGKAADSWRLRRAVIEGPSGYRKMLDNMTGATDRRSGNWSADVDTSLTIPLSPETVQLVLNFINIDADAGNEYVFRDIAVADSTDTETLVSAAFRNGKEIALETSLTVISRSYRKDDQTLVSFGVNDFARFSYTPGRVIDVKNDRGESLISSSQDNRFPMNSVLAVQIRGEKTVNVHYRQFEAAQVKFCVKPEFYEKES